MSDYSFITNAHPSFIDSMYRQYQEAPESVEESWRTFFSGFDYAERGNGVVSAGEDGEIDPKELNVFNLIIGYRNRGHLLSDTNPIRERRDRRPKLRKRDFGLSDDDLDTVFHSGAQIGLPNATLREIIAKLQEIYCGHIGFEYNHISDSEVRNWIRDYVETHQPKRDYNIPIEKKKEFSKSLMKPLYWKSF